MMGGDMMGWGWLLFGGLAMVIFWGGLIALLVLAVRGFTAGSQQSAPTNTTPPTVPEAPEEILRRRYAGGEMSREEYLEARTTLKA